MAKHMNMVGGPGSGPLTNSGGMSGNTFTVSFNYFSLLMRSLKLLWRVSKKWNCVNFTFLVVFSIRDKISKFGLCIPERKIRVFSGLRRKAILHDNKLNIHFKLLYLVAAINPLYWFTWALKDIQGDEFLKSTAIAYTTRSVTARDAGTSVEQGGR